MCLLCLTAHSRVGRVKTFTITTRLWTSKYSRLSAQCRVVTVNNFTVPTRLRATLRMIAYSPTPGKDSENIHRSYPALSCTSCISTSNPPPGRNGEYFPPLLPGTGLQSSPYSDSPVPGSISEKAPKTLAQKFFSRPQAALFSFLSLFFQWHLLTHSTYPAFIFSPQPQRASRW